MEAQPQNAQTATSTTAKSQTQSSKQTVEQWLERHGFKREIAGDKDFELLAKAIRVMSQDIEKRGLLLIGKCGCGKTKFMETLYRNLQMSTGKYWVDCCDDDSIDYLIPARNSCYGEWLRSSIFIDDMGSDPIRNEYGIRIDPVGSFIEKYYRKGKGRLFISTNLGSNIHEGDDSIIRPMVERYGARVVDRILDTCVVVKMSGGSKRSRLRLK